MKKALKIVWRTLLALFLTVYVVVALLNYSLVQSLVASYVGSRCSEAWGGEVRIGSLGCNPLNHLVLRDVLLVSPDNDTICSARKMSFRFAGFPYGDGGLSFSEARLHDVDYHLAIDSNGLNLRHIINYYASHDTTTKKALVGSWVYDEPAIQFESQNLLDQAGGVVASQSVADNIKPYFEALGLKNGGVRIDLREDNTCTFTLGGQTINGTYEFDDETKKLSMKAGYIPLPTAYLSIVNNQMAMTYDSSLLLNIIKVIGSASSAQSNLASISKLADSYDGMKTGFTFTRSK